MLFVRRDGGSFPPKIIKYVLFWFQESLQFRSQDHPEPQSVASHLVLVRQVEISLKKLPAIVAVHPRSMPPSGTLNPLILLG
jgi:hypothetical protein